MGNRDYYKPGCYNAICQVCGRKRKSDEIKRRWDGLLVCSDDYEPRQPQDFVRGVPDPQAPPWTAPEPGDVFINPGDVTPSDL